VGAEFVDDHVDMERPRRAGVDQAQDPVPHPGWDARGGPLGLCRSAAFYRSGSAGTAALIALAGDLPAAGAAVRPLLGISIRCALASGGSVARNVNWNAYAHARAGEPTRYK
jgi:hypothetical protein